MYPITHLHGRFIARMGPHQLLPAVIRERLPILNVLFNTNITFRINFRVQEMRKIKIQTCTILTKLTLFVQIFFGYKQQIFTDCRRSLFLHWIGGETGRPKNDLRTIPVLSH